MIRPHWGHNYGNIMNESGELLLVRLEERLKTLFDNQVMDRQDRDFGE